MSVFRYAGAPAGTFVWVPAGHKIMLKYAIRLIKKGSAGNPFLCALAWRTAPPAMLPLSDVVYLLRMALRFQGQFGCQEAVFLGHGCFCAVEDVVDQLFAVG